MNRLNAGDLREMGCCEGGLARRETARLRTI